MTSIFRYPGSKWSLAEWIISHFPPEYEKLVYLEPFCGSGAVFFHKRPGVVETINDLDSDVVNLFRVLRDSPQELRRVLALTPYSREEYDLSFVPAQDPVEKARRFMVRTNQAIGAKMDGKCGWRNHKRKEVGGTACRWGNITDVIDLAARRLRGSTTNLVQIEHRDALDLIARYNSPDVLMYLDPPYLRGTRKGGRLYSHEMDDGQHRELLRLVCESRARIVLSGYASALYEKELICWYRDTAKSQTTSTKFAQEVIWMNFEPFGQMNLYNGMGEMTNG